MKQLAWLHATPKDAKKSRLAEYKSIDEESSFLKMPEVGGAMYIIGMLQEAGLMSSNGMGPVPLSWLEIYAWLKVTSTKTELWERMLVKELSEVYVGQLLTSSDRNCPPPYAAPAAEEIDREAVANKLLSALRSMKRSQ